MPTRGNPMTDKKQNGSSSEFFDMAEPCWKFRERLVRTLAEIAPALRGVTAEMIVHGYSYMDVFSVRWSLREAILNGIQHGHRGDPSKTVRLNYLVSPDYLLAEVIDEGAGFDCLAVPNPFATDRPDPRAKKGLFFMRLFMSWIRFEGRGNRLTLCKMRSEPAQSGANGHSVDS